jgi:hypothetical protein
VLGGLWLLGACAAAPPAPPPPRPVSQADETAACGAYGRQITYILQTDPVLMQILVTQHVTQTLDVGLIVDPNGNVERGFMIRMPGAATAQMAVLAHLIGVHFGSFLPNMPNRKVLVLVPVRPPAVI